MSVLIGHPTGTPFSHHAALSYHETGQLAAYCLAWMPSATTLGALKAIAPLRPMAERLGRRRFEPLADAPLLQGRLGEWRRLILRAAGQSGDATGARGERMGGAHRCAANAGVPRQRGARL